MTKVTCESLVKHWMKTGKWFTSLQVQALGQRRGVYYKDGTIDRRIREYAEKNNVQKRRPRKDSTMLQYRGVK